MSEGINDREVRRIREQQAERHVSPDPQEMIRRQAHPSSDRPGLKDLKGAFPDMTEGKGGVRFVREQRKTHPSSGRCRCGLPLTVALGVCPVCGDSVRPPVVSVSNGQQDEQDGTGRTASFNPDGFNGARIKLCGHPWYFVVRPVQKEFGEPFCAACAITAANERAERYADEADHARDVFSRLERDYALTDAALRVERAKNSGPRNYVHKHYHRQVVEELRAQRNAERERAERAERDRDEAFSALAIAAKSLAGGDTERLRKILCDRNAREYARSVLRGEDE